MSACTSVGMNTNLLDAAIVLSDGDLLARIPVLAAGERGASAQLVAHLAALRLRPSLYAAQGYGSLFAYCRHALGLSEDAAANRIHAARACLRFPVILDGLASGELSLSAVRMLRPHLTTENHEHVLGRARNARRADIERLVAELAPRPDVPSSVRNVPVPRSELSMAPLAQSAQDELPELTGGLVTASPSLDPANREGGTEEAEAARNQALRLTWISAVRSTATRAGPEWGRYRILLCRRRLQCSRRRLRFSRMRLQCNVP